MTELNRDTYIGKVQTLDSKIAQEQADPKVREELAELITLHRGPIFKAASVVRERLEREVAELTQLGWQYRPDSAEYAEVESQRAPLRQKLNPLQQKERLYNIAAQRLTDAKILLDEAKRLPLNI